MTVVIETIVAVIINLIEWMVFIILVWTHYQLKQTRSTLYMVVGSGLLFLTFSLVDLLMHFDLSTDGHLLNSCYDFLLLLSLSCGFLWQYIIIVQSNKAKTAFLQCLVALQVVAFVLRCYRLVQDLFSDSFDLMAFALNTLYVIVVLLYQLYFYLVTFQHLYHTSLKVMGLLWLSLALLSGYCGCCMLATILATNISNSITNGFSILNGFAVLFLYQASIVQNKATTGPKPVRLKEQDLPTLVISRSFNKNLIN